jgi:hypothetical protein
MLAQPRLRDHWAQEKIRLARLLHASLAAQVYMNIVPGAACHLPFDRSFNCSTPKKGGFGDSGSIGEI